MDFNSLNRQIFFFCALSMFLGVFWGAVLGFFAISLCFIEIVLTLTIAKKPRNIYFWTSVNQFCCLRNEFCAWIVVIPVALYGSTLWMSAALQLMNNSRKLALAQRCAGCWLQVFCINECTNVHSVPMSRALRDLTCISIAILRPDSGDCFGCETSTRGKHYSSSGG